MSSAVSFVPVRVAIAGLGRAGAHHLERISLRDDCRVVALHDDCASATARVGGTAARIHAEWSKLLEDDEIELVIVATPPALHAEMAITALSAGRHVAVETPLGMNVAEIEAIRAASRRAGRTVRVMQTRRWDDDFRTASEALAAGTLGRPTTIKLINWHYNPWPPKPLRETQANGPAPSSGTAAANSIDGLHHLNWRDNASTGGGVLWEFGAHYFDQLLQLTGRLPQSVFARIRTARASRADDAFAAILCFEDDLVAHVEVDRLASAPLQTGWTIAGDSGSYSDFTCYVPNPDGEVVDIPLSQVVGEPDEYYTQLVHQLRLGSLDSASVDEALRTVSIIEAVRKSARTGEVVRLEHSSTRA